MIMSNSKERLNKGHYITEAMLDALSPLYDFCITNPKSSDNKVDLLGYQPSKFTFKDLDQIPSIGDIVFESESNRVIKVKQIAVSRGKVVIALRAELTAIWYTLDKIHPIKLDHQVLIDLGFEVYGKDGSGANMYRLILYSFVNLKLTLDSYDGNLDRMVWIKEGYPLIHYLHELQGILRVSGRAKIISRFNLEPALMKVLTKSEYPLNVLPENNNNAHQWVNTKK